MHDADASVEVEGTSSVIILAGLFVINSYLNSSWPEKYLLSFCVREGPICPVFW
jgi:hypothetical protein